MANVWLGVVLVAVLAAVLLRSPPGLNIHEIDASFSESQTMQAVRVLCKAPNITVGVDRLLVCLFRRFSPVMATLLT
jgi:hypothetical protein